MSVEAVRRYFKPFDMADRVMVLEDSTATVELAAQAHSVAPDQIGKTLSFKVGDTPILIVVAGTAKIDNKKYKAQFAKKAKMLTPDEALDIIGHPVGGICPFGLKTPVDVYLDISLKRHAEIIPAAGDPHASIRLTLAELETYSGCKTWVDVCQ